jgi:hypothetical protein
MFSPPSRSASAEKKRMRTFRLTAGAERVPDTGRRQAENELRERYEKIFSQAAWNKIRWGDETTKPYSLKSGRPNRRCWSMNSCSGTPIVAAAVLRGKTGLSAATVNAALRHLRKIGIVEETTGRWRNRLFRYKEYMTLLNNRLGVKNRRRGGIRLKSHRNVWHECSLFKKRCSVCID